jgi:PAS domain S-box-containing protein
MYNINDSIIGNISFIETRITNFISQKDLSFTIFSNEKAWKKLIPHISNLLIDFLNLDNNSKDIDICKKQIYRKVVLKFIEANKMYKMNVDIGMLLEFIKYCKSCFIELIYESILERDFERDLIRSIEEFFDNIEISFCSNWSIFFKSELIKDFKSKNDIIIETLHKSEERYHLLVEQASDGIFIIDSFGNYIEVNTIGHAMLKYSHEEIINMNILNLVIPEEIEKANSELKKLNSGKSIISEWKLRCKNDELLTVELSARKLPDSRILGIVRDITQRKIAEKNIKLLQDAINYDKLKTEFFSNISHELRTPINVIMSALQMCEILKKEDSLDKSKDKLTRYFAIMKQNSYRLIKLVNNLIDITRIDSGYLNLELHNYNIVNVVEDIVLSVADYIENKGINLVFDTEIEEKIMACDPDKIERIMLNLLSNSIKFTKPGGSIFINMKDKKDSIIISVRDTGIGIPIEKQKLIFERFVQVDKSLSRNNEGSGIGLSLVKSLIEMHGGSITLKSIPNMGSTFTIKFPVTILPSSMGSYNSKYINQSNTERINIEFSDIYS